MSVAFYFDHNMQVVVMAALRVRGVDVLTAFEDGYDRRSDDEVLDRAQELSRLIVTHDQDFLELAADRLAKNVEFTGIIFCHLERASIGSLINDLELIAKTARIEEIRNQVVWVPL